MMSNNLYFCCFPIYEKHEGIEQSSTFVFLVSANLAWSPAALRLLQRQTGAVVCGRSTAGRSSAYSIDPRARMRL